MPAPAAGPCRRSTTRGGPPTELLFPRRPIRATAMRNLRRHAYAFAQRGVGVDGFGDVHYVGAHLDGQGDFADHVAGVAADHGAAPDFAAAPGFGGVVEQQLGVALVAAVGNGGAPGGPGEQALFVPAGPGPCRRLLSAPPP